MTEKFADFVHHVDEEHSDRQHISSRDGTIEVRDGGRAFTRRFMRVGAPFSEGVYAVRWLVAELNGVRVYYDGENVLVTTKDEYL